MKPIKHLLILILVQLLLLSSISQYSMIHADFSIINVSDTWEITIGSSEVTVSVLDTGILWTGELSEESRWENEAELNGVPFEDDDGNGYVDDFYGLDLIDFDNEPSDNYGNHLTNQHGTWIANIIASSHGTHQISLSPGIKIQNSRILSENGFGSLAAIGEAIQYAMDKKIDIISLSVLTEVLLPESVQEIISEAVERGIVFVVPRYNFGTGFFSGEKGQGVIAVVESEYGYIEGDNPENVVYAPSLNIPTLTRFGEPRNVSGVSFAVPLVSATLALMKSANPEIPSKYLPNIMTYSSSPLVSNGKYPQSLLNVYSSVANSRDFNFIDFDQDGILSGEEVENGSDPFDSESTPQSNLPMILLGISIVVILAVVIINKKRSPTL